MAEQVIAGPSGRELLRDGSLDANRPQGVSTGVTLLLVLATLIAVGGVGSLSQATSGVGAIALACFLGILARVLQAGAHHKATARVR